MTGRTVAVQFVRSALQSAADQGLDISAALESAGIAAELLTSDTTRVTQSQANRLVQELWRQTNDELAGFGPKPVPRGTFRMMTLGVIHAPDLGEALRRLVAFTRIATDFHAIEMREDSGQVRLSVDSGDHSTSDRFVVDILAALLHRFSGWLIGEQIALTSITLPGPAPSYAADYQLIYGIAPTFADTAAALAFPSHYLHAPVIRSEPELLELFNEQATVRPPWRGEK